MAERSGVALGSSAARLPALAGALESARAGVRTGGIRGNREFAAAHVDARHGGRRLVELGYDPQTAGGLLVSLPADRAGRSKRSSRARGLFLARIGTVGDGRGRRRSPERYSARRARRELARRARGSRSRRRRFRRARRRDRCVMLLRDRRPPARPCGSRDRGSAASTGPGCTAGDHFPSNGYHSFIEFSNRVVAFLTIVMTLVAWLAARRFAQACRGATGGSRC